MGRYTIEARQLSIGPAAHDFWVLKNDQNQIIAELHGFAFSPSKGKTIPIGFRDEDKLQAYVIPYTDEYIKNLPHDLFQRWQEEVGGYYAHDNQNSKEIYTGPDALDRWNTAVAAIQTINEQNLSYPKFGGLGKLYGLLGEPANSHSVYSTFADIMGITAYDFPWVLEPGFDERISLGESLSSHPLTTLIENSYSYYFTSNPGIFSQVPELWKSLTEMAGAVQEIETLLVAQSGLSTYVSMAHATSAMTGAAISATATSLGIALPAIGCINSTKNRIISSLDNVLTSTPGAKQDLRRCPGLSLPGNDGHPEPALPLAHGSRQKRGANQETPQIRKKHPERYTGGCRSDAIRSRKRPDPRAHKNGRGATAAKSYRPEFCCP